MKSLKDAIIEAINEYNEYRSPEANAKLIKMGKKEFILEFVGPFCESCGVYDYFEDFIYELKKLINIDIEIANFKEYDTGTFRVKYVIKNVMHE
ncbi:MAG: hypothetical protein QXK35_07785 [Nitrososphaerales archaeon]